jgi:hypothetical protein
MLTMGYNTKILFAKHLSREQIEDIIPDVFWITDEIINFETACSYRLSPSFALGTIGDWIAIWDPRGKMIFDRATLAQFALHEAMSFSINNSEDRYRLLYACEQQIVRSVMYRQSALVGEDGEKLPGETALLDEDDVWQSIENITGITFAQLEALEYSLISLD